MGKAGPYIIVAILIIAILVVLARRKKEADAQAAGDPAAADPTAAGSGSGSPATTPVYTRPIGGGTVPQSAHEDCADQCQGLSLNPMAANSWHSCMKDCQG